MILKFRAVDFFPLQQGENGQERVNGERDEKIEARKFYGEEKVLVAGVSNQNRSIGA